MSMASERSATFRRLHESGCFVIPNPWDAGSARVLQSLGFKALATTSAGLAWSLGRRDNRVSLLEVIEHAKAVNAAVEIPVNVDFEDGFTAEPARLAQNVQQLLTTGIAGLSIEDSTRNAPEPLYDFELAVERVIAAREAIDNSGTGTLLTARSEGFIVNRPDIDETIRRLVAFSAAGADCLYAPGIQRLAHIKAVVEAVAPKPVNILVWSGFTTVEQLAELGVRRISTGGALARAAWTGFFGAAREIAEKGTFGGFDQSVAGSEIEVTFRPDAD